MILVIINVVVEIEKNVAMSHKGKTILSYSLHYKLEARAYAKNNSISPENK